MVRPEIEICNKRPK